VAKKKIFMLQTGGTLGQEKGEDGVFRPSDKEYVDLVPNIRDLADITIERTVNIDSTNMGTEERAMLAKKIYESYYKYDGFVVVHGTNTMVDTCSALTYMIRGLGKPVVLTGSQKSIFVPGTDAINNLYYAVKAATGDFGEVVIVFGDKIVRGVRASKVSEQGLNAFDSFRIPPVAEIGIDIILNDNRLKRFNSEPTLFVDFETNIEFYRQTSGSSTKIFERYVDDEKIRGIIMEGYGAGNVQSRLVHLIEKAVGLGKPVLVVTNCSLGAADMEIYEVGMESLKVGAMSAGDMTVECAAQKLMYAIGKANRLGLDGKDKIEFVRDIISRNYAEDVSETCGSRFDI
jgi:L-asparaginase